MTTEVSTFLTLGFFIGLPAAILAYGMAESRDQSPVFCAVISFIFPVAIICLAFLPERPNFE